MEDYEGIPYDIYGEELWKYLPIKDILLYCSTSKVIKNICEQDNTWRYLLFRDFDVIFKNKNIKPKKLYMEYYKIMSDSLDIIDIIDELQKVVYELHDVEMRLPRDIRGNPYLEIEKSNLMRQKDEIINQLNQFVNLPFLIIPDSILYDKLYDTEGNESIYLSDIYNDEGRISVLYIIEELAYPWVFHEIYSYND